MNMNGIFGIGFFSRSLDFSDILVQILIKANNNKIKHFNK